MRTTTPAPVRLVRALGPAVAALLIGTVGLLASGQGPRSSMPPAPEDRTIIHVLNRIGFGPAPGDIERVRRMGLRAYIDAQLRPATIADEDMAARLSQFTTLKLSTRELAQNYFLPAQTARREQMRARQQNPGAPNPEPQPMRSPEQMQAMRLERQVLGELTQQKILRAAYSDRQLEEVMVDFWFNHFNVFAGKGATRLYLTEYERDAIRPHALGRFRDLLQATAESPAMLFYLDNWQSAAPEGARRQQMRRPFPVSPGGRGRANRPAGMNRPGTLADLPQGAQKRRPRGLNENYARELMELHTLGVEGGYTQQDVQEVARAFTGWTIAMPRQGGGFVFDPRMHDDGEKIVLGTRIAPGGGKKDGDRVLDLLAAHPSTARFISTKLARRLVADEPPASLVERAAARFRETGGDIREVVRLIVTSPEFFAADAYRAKVKTPFEFVVSAMRATGADASSALPLVQTLRELGMPLYMCQPPTGYSDKAEVWVNTGALLGRMNFALALTGGRFRALRPALSTGDTPSAAAGALAASVLADDLAATTRETIARATTTQQAVALLIGSPEFQRR